ncbi:hypothetical protein CGSHiEE_02990 [Haemophilus influenzae PittEE]|nr:hypothetical protein CGSHiEE_02990 [Haemophilus influenzae PittEE]
MKIAKRGNKKKTRLTKKFLRKKIKRKIKTSAITRATCQGNSNGCGRNNNVKSATINKTAKVIKFNFIFIKD